MPVRRIVGSHYIWTELLKPSFAFRTGAVRVYHAADRGDIAGLELGYF